MALEYAHVHIKTINPTKYLATRHAGSEDLSSQKILRTEGQTKNRTMSLRRSWRMTKI